MVQELNYQAETFDISVDGNKYPVSTSKLFLIQRMQDTCDELKKSARPNIPEFMDKIYDTLKKILGVDIFASIFKDREYDILFLSEFCCYLSEVASPRMDAVINRMTNISKKYSVENLNEPADPQIAGNG